MKRLFDMSLNVSVEGPYEEVDDIPAAVLLEALESRVAELRENPASIHDQLECFHEESAEIGANEEESE